MSELRQPRIYNFYKPKDCTSYDVIRRLKRLLPKKTKLGHFGTLDPFACGVLMIGVDGAQRLNEYIHEHLPKTYIAHGVLGQSTPTGDLTVETDQVDSSDYLQQEISKFTKNFIQEQLEQRFLGEYWQSPHKYSAAKYEGKPLHQWAREGVDIKKEQKRREIYCLNVLEYSFPKLKIEFTVSSGTYIRSLFSDCAAFLGTLGVLEDLERTKVGGCILENTITDSDEDFLTNYLEMDVVLDFSSFIMAEKEARLYSNGVRLRTDRISREKQGSLICDLRWVRNEDDKILGLAKIENEEILSVCNFN